MPTDPSLWGRLEQYGVDNAKLRLLLRFLDCRCHGSFRWHVGDRGIERCEVQLFSSGKPYEVEQVSRILLVNDSS